MCLNQKSSGGSSKSEKVSGPKPVAQPYRTKQKNADKTGESTITDRQDRQATVRRSSRDRTNTALVTPNGSDSSSQLKLGS